MNNLLWVVNDKSSNFSPPPSGKQSGKPNSSALAALLFLFICDA